MNQETFKVMDWLRAVRDQDYERFKDSSPEEIIRITREEASVFRKELEELRKSKATQEPKGGD